MIILDYLLNRHSPARNTVAISLMENYPGTLIAGAFYTPVGTDLNAQSAFHKKVAYSLEYIQPLHSAKLKAFLHL